MRKNPAVWIWTAGLVLTFVLYEVGPDRAARAVAAAIGELPRTAVDAIDELAARFRVLMRAATLSLFAVFLALAAASARRGRPVRWALVLVSALFLSLLYRPLVDGAPAGGQRWLGALLVAAAGAIAMTRRLGGGLKR